MINLCAGAAGAWLKQYQGICPTFVCVLSFTETGLIPRISAAGATPADRRYTALADAEFLATGDISARYPLPPLAAGMSPAFISRAVIAAQGIPLYLLSTGLPDVLGVPHIALSPVMAQSLETGQAMTLAEVDRLLAHGLHWGAQLAVPGHYLVVGECVVGGTTTAQAVLSALGYAVSGRMSSSYPQGNHLLKRTLVEQGLLRWRQGSDRSALSAVAAVGDPMQGVVTGLAIAASRVGGVLLAGGSQMLAVYGLIKAVAEQQGLEWRPEQVVVGTTRWVIEDASADTVAIAQQVEAPYLAAALDFSQSFYPQLRAYEAGYVKEGVGAGGCAIAAHLYQNWRNPQLRAAIETLWHQCRDRLP